MKIIKKGRPQTGWAKHCECTGKGNGGGGCGAQLLVEAGDLFRTHSSHYDGSTDTYITFKCPSCTVLTDINDYPPGCLADIPSRRTGQRGPWD